MEWSVEDEDYVVGFLNQNTGNVMTAVDATEEDAQVFGVYQDLEEVSDISHSPTGIDPSYVLTGPFTEFDQRREQRKTELSNDLSQFDLDTLADTALQISPVDLTEYFDPELQSRLENRGISLTPAIPGNPLSAQRWNQEFREAAIDEIRKYREERGEGFLDYQALANDTKTAWTESYGHLTYAGEELNTDW